MSGFHKFLDGDTDSTAALGLLVEQSLCAIVAARFLLSMVLHPQKVLLHRLRFGGRVQTSAILLLISKNITFHNGPQRQGEEGDLNTDDCFSSVWKKDNRKSSILHN